MREGHEIDGIAVQNLAVEVKGVRTPEEVVIVGAHYDSAAGQPRSGRQRQRGRRPLDPGPALQVRHTRAHAALRALRQRRAALLPHREHGRACSTPKPWRSAASKSRRCSASRASATTATRRAVRSTRSPGRALPDHGELRRGGGKRRVGEPGRSSSARSARAVEHSRRRRDPGRGPARRRRVRPLGLLADRGARRDDHGHGAVSLRALPQGDDTTPPTSSTTTGWRAWSRGSRARIAQLNR